MKITELSIDISARVVNGLGKSGGRAADGGISLPFLISMAQQAGDGDHVDIGSLYGASAIGVALMKKEAGLEGDVYCIDPYNTEKRDQVVHAAGEMQSDVSASAEALMANAEQFEVELKLVQAVSDPWPEELEDNTFVSAYIDGDHVGNAPTRDFENLRGRVSGYIGTDNFEEEYPDVVKSMLYAADSEDWFILYKNIIFIAIRRIIPMRSDQTYPQAMLAR